MQTKMVNAYYRYLAMSTLLNTVKCYEGADKASKQDRGGSGQNSTT